MAGKRKSYPKETPKGKAQHSPNKGASDDLRAEAEAELNNIWLNGQPLAHYVSFLQALDETLSANNGVVGYLTRTYGANDRRDYCGED